MVAPDSGSHVRFDAASSAGLMGLEDPLASSPTWLLTEGFSFWLAIGWRLQSLLTTLSVRLFTVAQVAFPRANDIREE